MVGRLSLLLVACAAAVSGCTVDPSMPLIPTAQRPATMSPAEAPARTADGFPNILADPVVVGGGLPRPQRVVDAEMEGLASTRNRAQAATRRIARTSFAGEMSRQARDAVADARAEIAASGNGSSGATVAAPLPDPDDVIADARREIAASGNRQPDAADAPPAAEPAAAGAAPAVPPAPAEPPDPARQIDPAAPLPRAVGPTP